MRTEQNFKLVDGNRYEWVNQPARSIAGCGCQCIMPIPASTGCTTAVLLAQSHCRLPLDNRHVGMIFNNDVMIIKSQSSPPVQWFVTTTTSLQSAVDQISDLSTRVSDRYSVNINIVCYCGTTKTTEVLSVTANCVTAIYIAVLVNALCQPVYDTSIPCMWTLLDSSFSPPPHLCIRNLLINSCLCSFFQLASIKIAMRCCPHTCGWWVIHKCVPTNGIQQLVHSAPQSSPQKIARVN